jgi:hypothetical protein
VILDVENPEFYDRLDICIKNNETVECDRLFKYSEIPAIFPKTAPLHFQWLAVATAVPDEANRHDFPAGCRPLKFAPLIFVLGGSTLRRAAFYWVKGYLDGYCILILTAQIASELILKIESYRTATHDYCESALLKQLSSQ